MHHTNSIVCVDVFRIPISLRSTSLSFSLGLQSYVQDAIADDIRVTMLLPVGIVGFVADVLHVKHVGTDAYLLGGVIKLLVVYVMSE